MKGGEPTLFILNKVTRNTVTRQKHPRATRFQKRNAYMGLARVDYDSKKAKKRTKVA